MTYKLKDWIDIYNKNLNIEVWSCQSIIFKGRIKDFKYYEIFKDCKIIEQSVNSDFHYFYINISNLVKQ
ncbi:MAG: hypothetical protein EIB84_06800 [Spiroplasma poulsonii]|uniref:Uncharacterized protein n=1 Tax=Spiroplasma poulsonii TaxID=2138 RepID=A0A2P6FFU0_9MOLU|nr:hypothetical protein [Spiroplasma poulsonii]KAF0850152.1 hypothetical protein MSROBK_022650 [Spiroplasma poulsonii]MBW1242455.1 hypothetical protein [Spiroplasma poulsonii]PQM32330.1 hypothetical protein SMSRO_SF022380 [Spiroplasma poulsonii]PWF94985.1 hypothetical protein SMSE_04090 [Spiroplasma poulsonii]PWF97779.1 hypothetical protein SMH99_03280 [Spiroplasma poulsonii]